MESITEGLLALPLELVTMGAFWQPWEMLQPPLAAAVRYATLMSPLMGKRGDSLESGLVGQLIFPLCQM